MADKKLPKYGTNSPAIKLIYCSSCGKEKSTRNFYKSNSPKFKDLHQGYCPTCKDCLKDSIYINNGQVNKQEFIKTLKEKLDLPFYNNIYLSALEDEKETLGIYIKNLNTFGKGKLLTFENGETEEKIKEKDSEIINNKNNTEIMIEKMNYSESDLQNKEDVIRMVGYDPFESENQFDKKYLYNTLVDFLDESTLEDSFKLPIVIEIVKSFNQLDKINQALALMTANVSSIQSQVGGVKALFDAKQKIYSSILSMAKDNGISVNHSNNKSKGAGTLSGIIKKLQELGFSESDINLFDIETCGGIKQVADISNKSILSQLMFDENDLTEMISEQRTLIEEIRNKLQKLEEENRLLKLELIKYKGNIN